LKKSKQLEKQANNLFPNKETFSFVQIHAIVKKTAKTPKTDLDKAKQLRQLYFDLKGNTK